MLLEYRKIQVDKVDFTNCWNLHPWELYTLSGELVTSLSRTGILHPPVLLAKDENRFEIVSGFKRLLFASSIAKTAEVGGLIFAKDTEPVVILDIVLTDQGLARPLSLVEKAQFIEICSRYLQPSEIIDTFCTRLSLDKRPSTLSSVTQVLKQHPLLISEVHCGALQDKIVVDLLRLPSATDRIAMVKLFRKLCMGDGKQRKVLPLVRDLAFRKNLSVAAFLEGSSVQEILQHPAMNNPQKLQHLVSFLQHQTNPVSTDAESEFVYNVKSLKLPANWTITHSPSFEKDEVTLSITFNNLSTCQESVSALKRDLT